MYWGGGILTIMTVKKGSIKIYYDGACPMCVAFKEQSEKNTDPSEILFLDIHSKDVPNFLDKKELLSEIYAVDQNNTVLRGSDAIFATLSKNKKLYWLSYIGKLPLIKQCARPTYRLIAARRHFIFGKNSRIFWVRIVTIVGLLIWLLFSLSAWLREPMSSTVIPFENTVSTILFLALIPTLLWSLVRPRPHIALLLSSIILGVLVLLNYNWK